LTLGSVSARCNGIVVAFATRWPLATITLVLGLAGASVYYSIGHLGINTDTANMISPDLDWRQDFIAYRASFPSRDQNIVAVVDGPDGETAMAHARALAQALRAEPGVFPSVFLAGDGEFFEENGLLYLPIDELETLADRLIEAQPLLARLADDPGGAGVVEALETALAQSDELPGTARADIDRILAELAATLQAANAGTERPIAWGDLLGVGEASAARQMILIKPRLDFSRVRPARDAIERIREIAAGLPGAGAVQVRLTGTLAMEHEELTSITRSTTISGIASTAMVILVLFWALRSLPLLAVAATSLLAGLCLTAGFAALAIGHLNLLSAAFAVLYVGLGGDFILHMTLRLKEPRASMVGIDEALQEMARGVGSSLIVCAATTAAGFFAFIPTDFDGIAELGLISGVGMFISLGVSMTLLPALLKVVALRRNILVVGSGAGEGNWSLPALPPRLTVGLAAAAVGLSLLVLPRLEFDGNPIRLRDPDTESIRTLEDLATDRSAPLFNLAVLVPDAATARATAERVTPLETVDRVVTVAALVPADQDDKLVILEDLDLVLGSTLSGFGAGTAEPERLRASLASLAGLLAARPAPSAAANAFMAQASTWLAGTPGVPDDASERRAAALDRDIRGNLDDQLVRLERGLRTDGFGPADLPVELMERWVNPAGEQLVEIGPKEDLNDPEAAARFVADVRSAVPNATGLPVVYEEASATVTRAFAFALAWAFSLVVVILLLVMRSLRDTLLVLSPVLFAAVVTGGICVLTGLPLNFANIIALPLLVGVSVDSGIHIVYRMRTEPPAGGDPLSTSTSRAVVACALTTVASFGNLAFSSHYGMSSLGQLLTLGMVMSLIGALAVLPALMRLGRRP
jgi:hopanoid biosynthesis associated RND transporter like protein HpnN